jgi:RNA polymerase sigma-70 factor (ECF subfamily)
MHEERELLRRIAKGDEFAFQTVYNAYRDRIYATSRKLLHSTVLAEEIVQDVFLTCWLKRETLPEIEFFSSWLMGIARHRSFAAFNAIAKQGLTPMEEDTAWIADDRTNQQILGNDIQAMVQEAVKRLSPRQAQVFRLSKEQGYTREEVATLMNISPETVKGYLADATRWVRAYFAVHMEIPLFLVLSSALLLY